MIELLNVGSGGDHYAFFGVDAFDRAALVSSAGDVDGDGLADFLIGANDADGVDNNESGSGSTYLIMGADLADIDDDNTDGVIDLRHVWGAAPPMSSSGRTLRT